MEGEGELTNKLKPANMDKKDTEIRIEQAPVSSLVYRISDVPPIPVSIVFSIQVCLQIVSVAVTNAILVSEAICGTPHVTAKLMSTSMFLAGLTTFIQSTIGVRLPVFQGPSIYFVVPLLARADLPDWTCVHDGRFTVENGTTFSSTDTPADVDADGVDWRPKLLEISGVLMVVSVIHTLIGALGLGGIILRIIGPLTIVPAVVVMILKVGDKLIKFALVHVGVMAFTVFVLVILTTYMKNVLVPIPYWTRKYGWRTTKSRFLRTYAVLISIGLGWLLCHILTITGALPDDPNSVQYEARTDNKGDVIELANWFFIPYPGQFGTPKFSLTLFFGLMVAMLSSVIDSLADYNVVSRITEVPIPPAHSTNRGLLIEGLCSILSGAFGAGLATSTNIAVSGSLVISGMSSRRIFHWAGILMMVLGVVGKIGAFFVIIPKPVVGGVLVVILGSVIGTLLAELNDFEMKRPRNCMTVGLAILLGTMIPKLIVQNQELIDTGVPQVNHLITALFGTPLFVAGVAACILDNTLPGGRGQKSEPEDSVMSGDASVHRLPYLHEYFLRCNWTRFCPFLPGFLEPRDKNSV